MPNFTYTLHEKYKFSIGISLLLMCHGQNLLLLGQAQWTQVILTIQRSNMANYASHAMQKYCTWRMLLLLFWYVSITCTCQIEGAYFTEQLSGKQSSGFNQN